MKGKLIAIEGIDGTGKSTLARALHQFFVSAHIPCVLTREPGGTPLGEQIRHILLSRDTSMCAEAETLLFQASRAEHVRRVIEPALNGGSHVITDRYKFTTSAYQGAGLGLSPIGVMVRPELIDIPPVDYLIVMDAPVELAMSRIGGADRIEGRPAKFFQRARDYFLEAAELYCENSIVIDASLPPEVVLDRAEAFLLQALFKNQ